MKQLMRAGWLLSLGILLSSCGTKPGIELLKQPIARDVNGLLVGPELSATSRKVLTREGLWKTVKTDPDQALRVLRSRLETKEDLELRQAAVDLALAEAYQHHSGDVHGEIGSLLAALELGEPILAMPPSSIAEAVADEFNGANAALAARLHQMNLPLGKRLAVNTPFGLRRLAWSPIDRGTADPSYYDTLTPRNLIEVRGFDHLHHRPRVGGTLVGYRERTEKRLRNDPMMPHPGYAIPLTAIVKHSGGTNVDLVLFDSLVVDSVVVDGVRHPLAADYTAAVATIANTTPGSKFGFAALVDPDKGRAKEGLYLLEPYRDDRIPLVLVHGLLSTPATWIKVVNACYADPTIRKNYQLLVFFYPTGFPIPQNSASLREDLKKFKKEYDPEGRNAKMRDMIMVGHSMGCNLTNFQIREGGDRLWYKFFKESVDEMSLDHDERWVAKRAAYFKANSDITRVVFICGPHQGSPLSNKWLGRFGAHLIHFPFQAMDMMSGSNLSEMTQLGNSAFAQSSSSINNLKVDSPVLEAILQQPMTHHPKIHSIIGDRGRASGPGSSDGVVPYWSSHLDGVQSEFFIPDSHMQATGSPEMMTELRRILYLHVGKKVPSPESVAPQN